MAVQFSSVQFSHGDVNEQTFSYRDKRDRYTRIRRSLYIGPIREDVNALRYTSVSPTPSPSQKQSPISSSSDQTSCIAESMANYVNDHGDRVRIHLLSCC